MDIGEAINNFLWKEIDLRDRTFALAKQFDMWAKIRISDKIHMLKQS